MITILFCIICIWFILDIANHIFTEWYMTFRDSKCKHHWSKWKPCGFGKLCRECLKCKKKEYKCRN